MTKRFPATQQPAAKQPNSPSCGTEDTARFSKASRFKLRFRPFYDKMLCEVPRVYLWELAGYNKNTANGNLLLASRMAVEYLKELGLIKQEKKRPRNVKYCACCHSNPCSVSKKICGKCERNKRAALDIQRAGDQRKEDARLACEIVIDSISEAECPQWFSAQWKVS